MKALNRNWNDGNLDMNGKNRSALLEGLRSAINTAFPLRVKNEDTAVPQAEGAGAHRGDQVRVRIHHNHPQPAGEDTHETGAKIPTEPVIFFKSTTALIGPHDNLVIPKNGTKVDWEVELAVVIGKRALYVPRDKALEYVAGYALHNDYSERAFQKDRGGQWVKGKSCDTFAPLGPYLATLDELADLGNMKMWLKVNGETRQNSSTANMIFDVATLVSYISEFMTLLPGDVISTGTPAGVGLGMKPPQYLKAGDVVELGIDGLGESRQHVVNFSAEQHYSQFV